MGVSSVCVEEGERRRSVGHRERTCVRLSSVCQ